MTDTRVVYVIKLTREGNQWCAMLGDDPVTADQGYGDTPSDALRELATNIEPDNYPTEEDRVDYLESYHFMREGD